MCPLSVQHFKNIVTFPLFCNLFLCLFILSLPSLTDASKIALLLPKTKVLISCVVTAQMIWIFV